jgi:hypothetical protein
MASLLRLHAVDLEKFRAVLGSGEERFCAKVLKALPAAAEKRGLRNEWKRAVTGLILGDQGAELSSRPLFGSKDLTKADPALSLAFASVVEGFALPGLGGTVEIAPGFCDELLARPLFGLEPDGVLVRWGGLDPKEVRSVSSHPGIAPIAMKDLAVIGLSGAAWTD